MWCQLSLQFSQETFFFQIPANTVSKFVGALQKMLQLSRLIKLISFHDKCNIWKFADQIQGQRHKFFLK